jgi:hypothetical protein
MQWSRIVLEVRAVSALEKSNELRNAFVESVTITSSPDLIATPSSCAAGLSSQYLQRS